MRPCDYNTLQRGVLEFLSIITQQARGAIVTVSLGDVENYITEKFKCDIDRDRLSGLLGYLINKHNGGRPKVKIQRSDIKNVSVNKSGKDTLTVYSRFPSKQFYRTSNFSLPPYPVRHQTELKDGKVMAPNTMAMYYSDLDPSKPHGVLDCDEYKNCPQYHACDLDTNKCVSTDRIPEWTMYKGKLLAGSGKVLIDYLLGQGVPIELILSDMPGELFYKTSNMKEYIDIINDDIVIDSESDKSVEFDESDKSDKSGNITLSDLTIPFSRVIKVNNYTIDTSGWPNGLLIIPDFLRPNSASDLYTFLNNKEWTLMRSKTGVDYKRVQQYGYEYNIDTGKFTPTEVFPTPLACIATFLYEHKFVSKFPNQIIVNKFNQNDDITPHIPPNKLGEEITILSLGTPRIISFSKDNANIQVPFIPGSLAIISNTARYEWLHSMSNNVTESYKIPGQPEQKWTRGDRIGISFRTVVID